MIIPFLLSLPLLGTVSAFARGDRVIPQVPDGPNIRTKIDLINISSRQAVKNFKIQFFRQDGTPWKLNFKANDSQEAGSEYILNLVPRQTLRIETAGLSSPTASGYVIVADEESKTTSHSRDFVLGISVYYEVYAGAGVVDTVSVPVTAPTAIGTFPVEIDQTKDLYTGFAIVSLMSGVNKVVVSLYAADGKASSSANFTMAKGEQRAEFLNQRLFPGLKQFKGMAEFSCDGPVAILALLQTRTAVDVQYATLVATDKEALRHNSYVFLPQAVLSDAPYMPFDIDALVVDYLRQLEGEEGYPWDITYETESKTARSFKPWNGAALAKLGKKSPTDFDAISITELKSLSYSTNKIDMSDGSEGLNLEFTIAIRTDLGYFAKARIIRIVEVKDDKGDLYKDLGLEVYVFR